MMHKLIVDGELVLYGDVGDMYGDGSGFSARDVLEALVELNSEKTLNVRVNSPGGLVFDGMSIYNALRMRGNVNVYVDGIAASAASVIAMAGDEIVMGEGALIMIHDPSGFTWGTAADHEKNASVLNKLGEQAAKIYANRTGMSAKEMRAMMLTETWLDGEEAVEFKFATRKAQDAEQRIVATAKFDYRVFNSVPPHVAAQGQRDFPSVAAPPQKTKEPSEMPTTTQTQPAQPVMQVQPVAPVVTMDVTKELMTRGATAKLSLDKVMEIVNAAGSDLSKGQDLIIEALASRDPNPASRPAVVLEDGVDRFKLGVQKALEAKAGLDGGERNEFSGMTLREIARESLRMSGNERAAKMSDPMKMIGEAFRPTMAAGMHSTSDFVEILGNTANKSMLKGFDEVEENFPRWTGKGVLGDFKIATRVDMGLFPNLSEVPEGAEYSYATMSDRKVTLQLATYGKMFAITRQGIINDDLSMFTRIPNRMGRASKRTIGNLVYAQITGNVTLDDGVALFHADHANLTTASGGPPTAARVGVGRQAMALQTDPDDTAETGLNIRPRFWLGPLELEDTAKVLFSAEFDPAATGDRVPNPVRSALEVITDARLSASSALKWYMVADPSAYDTIEVLYLNGVETPMMEQRDGWSVDGVEFKIRMDTGVKTLDHRGFYQNDGD